MARPGAAPAAAGRRRRRPRPCPAGLVLGVHHRRRVDHRSLPGPRCATPRRPRGCSCSFLAWSCRRSCSIPRWSTRRDARGSSSWNRATRPRSPTSGATCRCGCARRSSRSIASRGSPTSCAPATRRPSGVPATDAAFLVWSQTGLASQRLTSSVELHNAAGAHGQPLRAEPARQRRRRWRGRRRAGGRSSRRCSPFFAEERRLLHAGRGDLRRRARRAVQGVGGRARDARLRQPVVHLGAEPVRRRCCAPAARVPSRGCAPTSSSRSTAGAGASLYTSARTAPGRCPSALFAAHLPRRASRSGRPSPRGAVAVDAYVLNDRGAIYVLGIPAPDAPSTTSSPWPSWSRWRFAVFVRVARAARLVFGARRRRARRRRAARCSREVRASFYRKLFLAFVPRRSCRCSRWRS